MPPLGGEQHHTQPSSSLKSTTVDVDKGPVDNNEPARRLIELQPPPAAACDECIHQRRTMMDHPFVEEEQQEESSTSHAADVDKLLQDTDERLIRLTHAITQELHVDNQQQHDAMDLNESVYAGRVQTTDNEQETTDLDQEKILKTRVENNSEPYDLWAGWNVREFNDRPSSIDGAAQWRGIRSLSIDEKPASPPVALADELTLHSITKSLRSLSYASNSEVTRELVGPPTTRLTSQRPRSFSDYTLSSSTLNRPNGFSAATSSRLTSPTSASSSPLTASIFESSAPNNFVAHESDGRSPHSPTSPFVSSSFGTHRMESPEPWPSMSTHVGVRPRSSSAYESSSLSLDYQSSPMYHHNTSMTYPVGGYPLQHPHASLYPSSHHPASVVPHRYPSPHPDFRPTSTNPSTMGRHDQGTGEYSLQIDKVVTGDDQRTTLMIRNIPNKYTQQMLLSEINQHHHGQYDFFYLPIDFKNKCNMGYAFINFIQPGPSIISFYQKFDHQKWNNFNSEKVCAISYARLQGKQAMILRFQNSSLLEKHESYRPLVFHSSGPQRGQPEPFPSVKQQSMYKQKNMWNGPDLYVHPQHAALLTNAQMAMLHGFTPTTPARLPAYGTNYHTTDSRMNMQFHGNVPAVIMTRPPTNTFHNLPSYAA